MNFFKLYIGDYQRDTAHLSVTEHGAYLLMLQHYYATEKPLPVGKSLHRMLRAQDKAEREAIDAVSAQFWTVTDAGLVNHRADRELQKAGEQAETNRRIAVAREGARKAARTVHDSCADRGTNDQPNQTPDTRNTPISPQGGKRSCAVGLKAWLDSVKAEGQKPIPEDDAVFTYAEEVGIPEDYLRLAWLEFRHRYCQPDAKRYRDWRSVFRKAVRGNWLKLWFVDAAGAYGLTTVGHQAKKAHEERKAA